MVWRSTCLWWTMVEQLRIPRTRHASISTTTCTSSTTYHQYDRQCTNSPDCIWSTLSWTNYDCTCSGQQFDTTIRTHRHYGRQWSSNTCLPTMVCTRVSNTTVSRRKWPTIANSYQQWDQTLRIQVGLHAQCRRTTNCHTILRLWRTPTNCISFKVGRTRFYPYIWWRTKDNLTSKRIQHNIDQTTKSILPQSNNHSNSSKLPATNTTDTWRNNSNDCTDNIDSTRSRTNPWRKQWLLDVQQWRISSQSPQDKKKGTIFAIQDMPSSSR